MGRLLLALLVGLVGALIVHIGVIFAMPRVAEDSAWARLTGIMEPFVPTVLSAGGSVAPAAGSAVVASPFGFMDPAFVTTACRFSLALGPVRLVAEPTTAFWSASINARSGDNLYSINERLALDGRFDLVVGTQEQFETARLEGLVGEGDPSIPVVVSASELYLTLRGLVDQESKQPFVDRFIRSLTCEAIELGTAAEATVPEAR